VVSELRADQSGRAVYGMKFLRPPKHWNRWFESHSVCVYSVFVLSCVGIGLTMGLSPVQGVLPTVYKIKETEVKGAFHRYPIFQREQ
jgi:hypothetical protein